MKSRIVTEEWRDIPQFKGYYQMTQLGKVKSVDRIVPVNSSKKNQNEALYKGKIIKPSVTNDGYYRVALTKEHKTKHYSLARLLALTFPELITYTEDAKGLPVEELEINHKNECKWDNVYWNLEWCTKKYNHNYGTRNIRATRHTLRPVQQYTLSGELVKEYESMYVAGKDTGICWQSISACCRNYGYYKSAGGYIWKYKDKQNLGLC